MKSYQRPARFMTGMEDLQTTKMTRPAGLTSAKSPNPAKPKQILDRSTMTGRGNKPMVKKKT
jgi:hypothetical protein